MLAAATDEGQRFARMIGEPGAPSSFVEAYFQEVPVEQAASPAASLLADGAA